MSLPDNTQWLLNGQLVPKPIDSKVGRLGHTPLVYIDESDYKGWRAAKEVLEDNAGPYVYQAVPKPDEPGYRFQALVDTVREHVRLNGGKFKLIEGTVTYVECGHCLPAATAIDVTNVPEDQWREKGLDSLRAQGARPCPECARLVK